jgi:ABC-type dipeptide/oligopeptide/nickel transport system ATPase component
VEVGPAARVAGSPEHPYTRLLVESAARLEPPVREVL